MRTPSAWRELCGVSGGGWVKSREDLSILGDLNEAFPAINKTIPCEIDGSDKGGGKGKGRGRGQPKFRSWMERGPAFSDGALLSDQDDAISEKKVLDALSNLASDMWKSRIECPNWLELAAANTLHLSSTLQTKLVSKELIPYYAEYMETPSSPKAGIATLGACVLFDTGGSTGTSGDAGLRQVPKHHSNNIYVYISHCLKQNLSDPVLQSCTRKVWAFLAQTFWGNREALICTYGALCRALMSLNVDRAIWALGRGGVGQSLFTSLIDSAIFPRHGYLDPSVFFQDEELRRQLPLLSHFLVWTSQEASEGGAASKLRQDLYKKWSALTVCRRAFRTLS